MKSPPALMALVALASPPPTTASVAAHALFGDGAVLQQGIEVPVWGQAEEGEQVTVRFQDQERTTTASAGRWMIRLMPLRAGGPFTMTIAGKSNVVELRNVLVGEVWVCAGQSNMEMTLAETSGAEEALASSADPMLRLFRVSPAASDQPARDVDGRWVEAGPATAGAFSAVGYYFGRDLRKARRVPVGLVSAAAGRSSARTWISRAALGASPELRRIVEVYEEDLRDYQAALEEYRRALEKHKRVLPPEPGSPAQNPDRPAGRYNAMVAPLQPYAIRGVVWYQGESDAGAAHQYRTLFPALIEGWREDWGQGEIPFLFVQLAPFAPKAKKQTTESGWAQLRETQLQASLSVPRTAMVVTTDVGDENDLHPKRKEPIGARLALAARALAYAEEVVASGPLYDSIKTHGAEVVLSFRSVGGGLVARGGALEGFTIAGRDRRFVKAEARIEGDTVVVSSPRVRLPTAVRYGWADYPVVNLFNREGLPASPFRTDDFPTRRGHP